MTESRPGSATPLSPVPGVFPGWSGYVMAVVVTALAVWFRVLLTPLVGDQIPFTTVFFAVALAAWFGGAGPCLVTMTLGAIGAWYFVLPPHDSFGVLAPHEVVGLSTYALNGVIVALFAEYARNALRDSGNALKLCEESERRFRGFAEHTQDVLWITHGDRPELVYVNPAFNRVYGRTPDEIRADFRRLADYVHEDEQPRARTFWRRCGEGMIVEEFRVVRPDGSIAWIRRRGFPIPDERGNVEYRAGISEDITEEKRMQEERDRLLAAERTARQEAERNSRIKDEFLATLSHELRTPLNAVLGWVQVLKSTSLPEGAAQAVDAIARNSRAQAKLIDDLLDMSRIVSGKLRLEMQSVDLAPIVRATVDSVLPAADAKGIRIEQVLDPHAGPVKGDPSRLQQTVWNLLSNAVKFTSRGGRVHVHLERVNSHCEITVSDTGRGIPADFLPYVFDRFRQQDASTTRTEAGLGLGLAIVKQLVEHHGGSVTAKSDGEGRGATFIVRLPIAIAVSKSSGSALIELDPEGALSLQGTRVLVVDDDPDACLFLRRILEQHHATVETASSAASALALIESNPPDILLSDVGMAGEDGYQFIAAVRSLPERARRIPAIAITAYARPDDRIRALMAGYHMHVAKPIDVVELLTVIRRLQRGF